MLLGHLPAPPPSRLRALRIATAAVQRPLIGFVLAAMATAVVGQALGAQPFLYMSEDSIGGHLSVLDAATGHVVDRIQIYDEGTPSPFALLFHPDGHRVYVGLSRGDAVKLIDRNCRCIVESLTFSDPYQELHPGGMAFLPGAELFYVALADDESFLAEGTVAIVSVDTFEEVARIELPGLPTSVVVSKDGSQVFVSNRDPFEPSLSVIDTVTNQVVAQASYGDPSNTLRDLAITDDGKTVYAAEVETDSILKINAQTLALERTIQASLGAAYFTLGPGEEHLFVGTGTFSTAPAIDRINLSTFETEETLTLDGLGQVTGVEVEPMRNDLYVMIANEDRVDIIDIPTFTVASSLELARPISEGFVSSIRVGGDARDLDASDVLCWNLTTGEKIVGVPTEPAWDCASLGLAMSPGDEVISAHKGAVP